MAWAPLLAHAGNLPLLLRLPQVFRRPPPLSVLHQLDDVDPLEPDDGSLGPDGRPVDPAIQRMQRSLARIDGLNLPLGKFHYQSPTIGLRFDGGLGFHNAYPSLGAHLDLRLGRHHLDMPLAVQVMPTRVGYVDGFQIHTVLLQGTF